jgi:TrmH RNA methyltransferase
MIRSAAFFDAAYIILSETDEEARLTTSAFRVAEGGMEQVVIRRAASTGDFLRRLPKSIFSIGAELRARLRIRDLGGLIRDRPAARGQGRPGIALVMGNEETGLPPEVQDRCGVLVRIPGTGIIESLNVAHAATLFLHELYEL